jgi:hypothetical protein
MTNGPHYFALVTRYSLVAKGRNHYSLLTTHYSLLVP